MDHHAHSTRRALLAGGAALLALATAAPLAAQVASTPVASSEASAVAAPAVVQMLNASTTDPKKKMVFEPAIVRIPKGGTVQFKATDPSHNAQTVKGMLPEGAEAFKTAIGKDGEVTFTEEGVYGFACAPHTAMGMVGLVIVGDPEVNWEEAKAVKHRGKVADAFEALFAEAEAEGM